MTALVSDRCDGHHGCKAAAPEQARHPTGKSTRSISAGLCRSRAFQGVQSCPRLKTSFASRLNWIPRFKPLAQNISISFFQKSCLYRPIPPHREGRCGQSSRNVRRGCDGRFGLRDDCRRGRTSEIVWSRPPDAEVKRLRDVSLARRWLTSPAHRGEHV